MVHAALIGVLIAAGLCGPALWSGELLGSAGAETFGHAWVLGWATEAWPAWPTGTTTAVGAANWPVIDPLPTWLTAAAAQLVGVDVAWNLRVALAIVLAAMGGARLARAWGGNPQVGAAGTALMPIFLGSITSGLSEDLAVGLLAWVLAWATEKRWWHAALGVGLLAGCGLYLGWMGGVAMAALALRPAPMRELGKRAGALLLAATLAVGAAAPFAGRMRTGARAATPAVEAHWRVNPWRGADVASFVAPGKVDLAGAALREHPTYLGAATVGFAALGGTPAGWLAVAACVAVAPGDSFSVAGQPTGVANPAAAVLDALPGGNQLRNHARLMLLGQLLLVGLAARGAERLRRRWPRAGLVAGLVIVAEVVFLSPARAPLPGTPTEAPAIYAALSRAPAGLPVRVVGSPNPQAPFFYQRVTGRGLRNDPNRPDPGRPEPATEIIVAFGPARARLTEELGRPDVEAEDGAAWWPD
jgi:hypothetical protein